MQCRARARSPCHVLRTFARLRCAAPCHAVVSSCRRCPAGPIYGALCNAKAGLFVEAARELLALTYLRLAALP
eukprot:6694343-Lingulodinium_polyedra.AAC.1